MGRRKRTWYLKLPKYLSQAVNWSCHAWGTEPGEWSRYVQLIGEMEDGREIVLKLSPGEATRLGSQLITHAHCVSEVNHQRNNGDTYPDEREWAQ